MAIEFRCTQCGKLLRTADTTAGKQAKCPSCGTVVTIPPAGTVAESYGVSPPPEPSGEAWSPPQQPAGGAMAGFSENPFASPSAASFAPEETGTRTGPPWERDRPSVKSFIETVKQIYGSTAVLFSDMRREGGLGAPVGFAIAGGMIGGVISAAFQVALQGLGVMGQGGLPGGANMNMGVAIGGGLIGLLCAVIILPFAIALGLFINSGIIHLMLMMLGGAKYPFETTFRTIAYSAGGASLLSMVPICGGLLNAVAQIVFSIIGLTKTQEISGGKAAAAVLVPFCVCCGIAVLSVVAIIGMAAAGAAGGGKGF